MSRADRFGYVTVQRDLFDHPLFHGDRYSRREAWLWLIAAAAWKPRARRMKYGIVHLERGQLAVTVRELAERWLWSTDTVHNYLKTLENQGMIEHRTVVGTQGRTQVSRPTTLVSICNYDKFQKQLTGDDAETERNSERNSERKPVEAPELPGILAPQTLKQPKQGLVRQEAVEKGKRRPAAASNKPLPSDGLTAKGLRFCHYGGQLWKVYADDYRAVHGAEPMPANYANGRGRWFKQHGETGNPSQLWTADRIEAANA